MSKVNLVILHGIGKPKQDFAAPLVKGIKTVFNRRLRKILGVSRDFLNEIRFHPVFWDEVLSKRQEALEAIFKEDLSRRRRRSWLGIARRIGLAAIFCWACFLIFKNPVILALLALGALYYIPQRIYKLRTGFSTHFIGDLLAYRDKDAQEKIRLKITEAINSLKKSAEIEPISFAAHSLGDVIASDFIYDRQKENGSLHEEFRLSNFFTLGSPMALFSLQYGPQKFKEPILLEDDLGRWVNIFDKDDPVAFPLKSLNEAYARAVSKDQEVNTGVFGIAHVRYWQSPQVQEIIGSKLAIDWLRLNKALDEQKLNKLYKEYDQHSGL